MNRSATTALFQSAAGIAVATLDGMSPGDQADLRRGSAASPAADSTTVPTFMYVTSRFARSLLDEPVAQAQPGDVGKLVRGEATFTEAPPPYPARNVVAILPGKDPALKGEMVALGAHNDHIGITHVVFEHDSLRAFNQIMRREGANETPGVPTAEQQQQITHDPRQLEQAASPSTGFDLQRRRRRRQRLGGRDRQSPRPWSQTHRPKRSVLFVWHTGEEKGLIGSDWFTRHPTVPRDSIVAQLNIDMIGRGDASKT